MLLALLATELWLRGRGRSETCEIYTDALSGEFSSGNGLVRLMGALDTARAGPRWRMSSQIGDDLLWKDWIQQPNRAGFGWDNGSTVVTVHGTWKHGGRPILILYLPLWFVVPVTLLLPAWWLGQRLRRVARVRRGLVPGVWIRPLRNAGSLSGM